MSSAAAARADRAAVLRILSRYKRLVLLGKVALPLSQARRLVGPDCAFHLYGRAVHDARRRRHHRRRPQ